MNIVRMPARQWYGRHAAGSVVLVNGVVYFHGDPWAATRWLRKVKRRLREQETD